MTDLEFKRKQMGYSQMYCAAQCEVNINTWIRWEKGVANPTEENQRKIDVLFGFKKVDSVVDKVLEKTKEKMK